MKIKKHIPNILSSVRLLSPFVLTPVIMSGSYLLAIILLSGFLLTDAIDGFLARKWNVQSDLGVKLDAVADKIIVLSLLLPLLFTNKLLFLNLVMEAGISSINILRKLHGGKPKTLQIGRIKMIILSFFMGLNYLQIVVPISKIIMHISFIITLFFQGCSLVEYFKELIKEEKEKIINKKVDVKEIEKKETEKIKEDNVSLNKNKVISQNIDKKEELIKLKEELTIKEEKINKKNSR